MRAETGVQYGVALGAFSVAKTNDFNATAKGATFNGTTVEFAGANVTDLTGAVSVGTEQKTRQIQNVGAGRLSNTSTDAVNGSQLYAVMTNVGFNAAEMVHQKHVLAMIVSLTLKMEQKLLQLFLTLVM